MAFRIAGYAIPMLTVIKILDYLVNGAICFRWLISVAWFKDWILTREYRRMCASLMPNADCLNQAGCIINDLTCEASSIGFVQNYFQQKILGFSESIVYDTSASSSSGLVQISKASSLRFNWQLALALIPSLLGSVVVASASTSQVESMAIGGYFLYVVIQGIMTISVLNLTASFRIKHNIILDAVNVWYRKLPNPQFYLQLISPMLFETLVCTTMIYYFGSMFEQKQTNSVSTIKRSTLIGCITAVLMSLSWICQMASLLSTESYINANELIHTPYAETQYSIAFSFSMVSSNFVWYLLSTVGLETQYASTGLLFVFFVGHALLNILKVTILAASLAAWFAEFRHGFWTAANTRTRTLLIVVHLLLLPFLILFGRLSGIIILYEIINSVKYLYTPILILFVFFMYFLNSPGAKPSLFGRDLIPILLCSAGAAWSVWAPHWLTTNEAETTSSQIVAQVSSAILFMTGLILPFVYNYNDKKQLRALVASPPDAKMRQLFNAERGVAEAKHLSTFERNRNLLNCYLERFGESKIHRYGYTWPLQLIVPAVALFQILDVLIMDRVKTPPGLAGPLSSIKYYSDNEGYLILDETTAVTWLHGGSAPSRIRDLFSPIVMGITGGCIIVPAIAFGFSSTWLTNSRFLKTKEEEPLSGNSSERKADTSIDWELSWLLDLAAAGPKYYFRRLRFNWLKDYLLGTPYKTWNRAYEVVLDERY